jgi:hypothetical protein
MPFPVEVNLIHEAERQLGRKLPMDLRVRLQRENGGGIRAAGDVWHETDETEPVEVDWE